MNKFYGYSAVELKISINTNDTIGPQAQFVSRLHNYPIVSSVLKKQSYIQAMFFKTYIFS